MTRLAVTATDLDRADRLLARVAENDRNEVAKLLAEIREELLVCATIRAEKAAAGVLHDAAVTLSERLTDVNNPRMTCAPKKKSARTNGRTSTPTTEDSGQPEAASTAEPRP